MIKITVEIVPFGVKSRTRKLWEIEVVNTGTDKNNVADYDIDLLDDEYNFHGIYSVKKHQRDDGLAKLLARVFKRINKGNRVR